MGGVKDGIEVRCYLKVKNLKKQKTMSTTEQVTVGTLLQRTGNPEGVREAGLLPIDLSPDFQRTFEAWNNQMKTINANSVITLITPGSNWITGVFKIQNIIHLCEEGGKK